MTTRLDTNDTSHDTIVLHFAGNKVTPLPVQELGWVSGTSVPAGARRGIRGMRFGRSLPIAAARVGGARALVQVLVDHAGDDGRSPLGERNRTSISSRAPAVGATSSLRRGATAPVLPSPCRSASRWRTTASRGFGASALKEARASKDPSITTRRLVPHPPRRWSGPRS